MLRLGIGLRIVDGGGGLGIDPAASAIFAAFTTPPTAARQELINRYVVSLKASGVWAILDCLYVFAAHDSQAALINWKNPGTFNGSQVGTATFTQDRGFTGDGSTGYISSTFTPSSAGGHFTQNSAHVSARSLTAIGAGSASQRLIGNSVSASFRTVVHPWNTSNQNNLIINEVTSDAATSATSQGQFIGSRTAAAVQALYLNGSSVLAGTQASTGVTNEPVSFGADITANDFSTLQMASASIGGGLTAAQAANFYAADLAYMHGVGAA